MLFRLPTKCATPHRTPRSLLRTLCRTDGGRPLLSKDDNRGVGGASADPVVHVPGAVLQWTVHHVGGARGQATGGGVYNRQHRLRFNSISVGRAVDHHGEEIELVAP